MTTCDLRPEYTYFVAEECVSFRPARLCVAGRRERAPVRQDRQGVRGERTARVYHSLSSRLQLKHEANAVSSQHTQTSACTAVPSLGRHSVAAALDELQIKGLSVRPFS
ncbi:hypothetical protein ON010_g12187 [Phytophthora cinnamomi]|nr:hypothetical protein ON010_g12187 [Phytophthora cinnamomi]